MFSTKVVEEIKTNIVMVSNFVIQNNAVCEIPWKNMVQPDRPRRMRFACWITKATHTEYVILIAFLRQQWVRERASALRYTYIASPAHQ